MMEPHRTVVSSIEASDCFLAAGLGRHARDQDPFTSEEFLIATMRATNMRAERDAVTAPK